MQNVLQKLSEAENYNKFLIITKEQMMYILVAKEAKRIDKFNENKPKYIQKVMFDSKTVSTIIDEKMDDCTRFLSSYVFTKVSYDMFSYLAPSFQTDAENCCKI